MTGPVGVRLSATRTRTTGLILLILFTAGLGLGIARWIRLHRSGIPPVDAEGRA